MNKLIRFFKSIYKSLIFIMLFSVVDHFVSLDNITYIFIFALGICISFLASAPYEEMSYDKDDKKDNTPNKQVNITNNEGNINLR